MGFSMRGLGQFSGGIAPYVVPAMGAYQNTQAGLAAKEASQLYQEQAPAQYAPDQVAQGFNEDGSPATPDQMQQFAAGPDAGVLQARTRYGLGPNGPMRDTPYTEQERSAAGMRAAQQYWLERNPDKAMELGLKASTLEHQQLQSEGLRSANADAPLRRQLLEGQVASSTDAAKVRDVERRREETRDRVIREISEARAAAAKGDYSALRALSTEYNAQVPGMDDGQTAHFLGEKGDIVALTGRNGEGVTKPLTPELAAQTLDDVLSKRLAAISSKDWQHEREFQMTKGVKESDSEYKRRMAGVAERKETREGQQDELEWGKGGWRDRYLTTLAAKNDAGGKPQVKDVTWKNEKGEVQTGIVGLEMKGRRLAAYDVATGGEIAATDPRYKALLSGVPKNAKNDPLAHPEAANIAAKIKDGKAERADFERLDQIHMISGVKSSFEAAEESKGRPLAVMDLVERTFGSGGTFESPAAQDMIAKEMGVAKAEIAEAKKFLQQKKRQGVSRTFGRYPSVDSSYLAPDPNENSGL